MVLGNHATLRLAAAGPLRPRWPVVTLEARQGQHRRGGHRRSNLLPQQARRVGTGRCNPATSGVSSGHRDSVDAS